MKKSIFLLLILIGFSSNISASHLIGAELGWTCVGKDSFLIRLTLYIDCNGVAAAPGVVNIKCGTTGAAISSLGLSLSSPVDVTPICNNSCSRCQSAGCSFPYGIKRYIMQGIVDLSGAANCCSIKMSWEQSSRTGSITTGAGNANFYTEASFDRCQNPCTSSPQIKKDPIDIFCVGQDVAFTAGLSSSTAGSNDSLTYEWDEPLSTNNTPISYTGSYTYDRSIYFWGFPNAVLPFPRGLHLDPQSGDILFRPMKAEITVMVVKVRIFRNQVQIGEMRREICFFVISCTGNNPPLITTPNNVRSKSVCAGETVTFDFSTSDANPNDTVSISWNKALPGAIWTDSNGLTKYSRATLSWSPSDAFVSSLPYTFTVTARDNACPLSASFTQAYQITVKPKPKAIVNVIDSGCGNYWFTAQQIVGSGPMYLWQSPVFDFNPKQGKIIYHAFQPGIYPYSMTMAASGCTNTYFDTLEVLSDSIGKVSLPADTTICSGTSLLITPMYFYGKPPVKYYWSTGDTNKILNTGPIFSDLNLKLSVIDSNACTASDQMLIKAIRNPEISSDPVTMLCYNLRSIPVKLSPTYQVFGSNNSVDTLHWFRMGDTLPIPGEPVLFTRVPGYYVFGVTDMFGCMAMDTMQVILTNPIDTSVVIKDTILIAAAGMIQYDWYRNDSLIGSGQVNTLIVRQKGRYFVAITDSFGCIDSTGSIYVNQTIIDDRLPGLIKIYPNPTRGIVILEASEDVTGEINISIFNALGKQVMGQTRNNHQAFSEIDLSDQPSGTYTIIIHCNHITIHRLLIKE